MSEIDIDNALERITEFLKRWYPPEIAPLIVKRQVQAIGALRDELTDKDIEMLLGRIQMVILPSFMQVYEAKQHVLSLKREIGFKLGF